MGTRAIPLAERCRVEESGCWSWVGPHKETGYGLGRRADGSYTHAHRVVYEWIIGPIPAGLDLDHLCRNRGCVNPWHMEPVTKSVNKRRGRSPQRERTHCPAEHPYDEANTYVDRTGRRHCRQCRIDRRKAQ